ncbi:MAG: hypothetical protein ACRYF9_27945 [Janthinobacterium lividum]
MKNRGDFQKYRDLLLYHYPSMRETLEAISDQELELVVRVAFDLGAALGMSEDEFRRFEESVYKHQLEKRALHIIH